MKTLKKRIIGYALGAVLAMSMVGIAHAAPTTGYFGNASDTTGQNFAASAGLSGNTDLPKTIASIINTILSFLGIVAVVIILMGGFTWMTASGDESKVKKAKSFLIQGIIGLVIVISAFAIASYVIGSLTTAVGA